MITIIVTMHKVIMRLFHGVLSILRYMQTLHVSTKVSENTHTTVLTALCPGLPAWLVPKETFTQSHPSWSSDILYQLPSSTIHSILLTQVTCLTVLFHNLSPAPSWSSSWYGILCFLLCAFLRPVIIINTANIISLIPISLLAPYLEICLALKPCIHLTIVI